MEYQYAVKRVDGSYRVSVYLPPYVIGGKANIEENEIKIREVEIWKANGGEIMNEISKKGAEKLVREVLERWLLGT